MLDPVSGYLEIAKKLIEKKQIAYTYNFGPEDDSKLSVEDMAKTVCEILGRGARYVVRPDLKQPSESNLLWLSSERAHQDLAWRGKLNAHDAIRWTIEWERNALDTDALIAVDLQINKFFEERL